MFNLRFWRLLAIFSAAGAGTLMMRSLLREGLVESQDKTGKTGDTSTPRKPGPIRRTADEGESQRDDDARVH